MDRLERSIDEGAPAHQYRRIVHIHVPKTAGMAFSGIFTNRIENSCHLQWDRGGEDWREQVEGGQIPRFTTGHIRIREIFFEPSLALRGIHTVSVLRRPLDRVVSTYNYGRSSNYPEHESFAQRFPSIELYLERVLEKPNTQAAWITGVARHRELALHMINRFYLGLAPLNSIDDYAHALQLALLPGPPVPMERVNELGELLYGERVSVDDVPADIVRRYNEVNAVDLELFDLASEEWERRAGNLRPATAPRSAPLSVDRAAATPVR